MILLTNDDGFDAPGLRAPASVLSSRNSLRVAGPAEGQSGVDVCFGGRIAATRIPLSPPDCLPDSEAT